MKVDTGDYFEASTRVLSSLFIVPQFVASYLSKNFACYMTYFHVHINF